MDALDAVFARRSIARLVEPAPSEVELETVLRAAAVAPDHGNLRPWRFVILRGASLDAFGEVLAAAYRARCETTGSPPHPDKEAKERTKLRRAPLVVVVCAIRRDDADGKYPWDDQVGAAHAATQNLLLAATALGYGSMWRTGEPVRDDAVKAALGLTGDDAIVGFVYLGTPAAGSERERRDPDAVDVEGVVHEWHP